jgi:outer membrane protein OmpA-like peptidoglycan-associated protein
MRKSQHASLRAILASAIGAALLSGLTECSGLIEPAQAQSEAEKRKKEQEKQKTAPPRPQPPPKAPQPAPKVTTPPPPKVLQQQLPAPDKRPKQFQQQPPPVKPAKPLQQPPAGKPFPPKPATAPLPEPKKEGVKRLPPPGPQGAPPPTTYQKAPTGPPGPATVTPGPQPQGPVLKRFEEVRKGRIERLEDGGRRKVIEEPGNRYIIKQGDRVVVRSNESERFQRRPGARSERRPDGSVETFYVRRDGVRIVTVVDVHGRLLRRYRRDRDGRERSIIDNRRFYRNVGVGVGIGALGIIALNLPPPRVTIPYDRYVVDYDRASDDDLYEALEAPPIELLDRAYSLEEIRDNYELRARVRSVDIDTINFEFGAWEVPPDQYDKLERIARAILRVIERNPDAVVLIAGFTDAVGTDEDNASLSDRRAAAVAEVLSDRFGVPEENLVTQGYGEQYLKIDTQGPEPRNRRVSVQNITGLMAER